MNQKLNMQPIIWFNQPDVSAHKQGEFLSASKIFPIYENEKDIPYLRTVICRYPDFTHPDDYETIEQTLLFKR